MLFVSNNRIEYFDSCNTELGQDKPHDICCVYSDSFTNAHPYVRDEAIDAFNKWCNDYKKITKYYPQHRSAEKVFLKLKNKYDEFNAL